MLIEKKERRRGRKEREKEREGEREEMMEAWREINGKRRVTCIKDVSRVRERRIEERRGG